MSYIAELIGTYAAGYVSGRLADRLTIRLARRNGGIVEPEFRLWVFAVLAIIAPFGLLLYGLAAAHGASYWCLLVGMVAVGFIGPASGSLVLSYTVDCFHDLAGESLIAVVLIRNTVGSLHHRARSWLTIHVAAQFCFQLRSDAMG